MLTFDDAEPIWEWFPTPSEDVEAPREWFLFGGPLTAPLETPVQIKEKISGPLACPSGGMTLELKWGERDTGLEDFDTVSEISNPFDHMSHKDILPARQSWRGNDKAELQHWDCPPNVPSSCTLIRSKVTGIPKPRRASLRYSIVTAH
ncbi:hypothetical protein C0993_009349 [Termitomyces sp. T159_Od127]|nr:hypothetical protein C0993_009349 [Termitomyces sp. T159_Od127]